MSSTCCARRWQNFPVRSHGFVSYELRTMYRARPHESTMGNPFHRFPLVALDLFLLSWKLIPHMSLMISASSCGCTGMPIGNLQQAAISFGHLPINRNFEEEIQRPRNFESSTALAFGRRIPPCLPEVLLAPAAALTETPPVPSSGQLDHFSCPAESCRLFWLWRFC